MFLLSEVEVSILIDFIIIDVLLDKMLLNMLEVSIILNCDGFFISCIDVLLIYMWFSVILG